MEIGEDYGKLIGKGWNRPELRSGRWARVRRRNQARWFDQLEKIDITSVTFQLSVRPQPVDVFVGLNASEAERFRATPGFAE
jgi:hypothetical protein